MELEDKVLILRRIHVVLRLRADPGQHDSAPVGGDEPEVTARIAALKCRVYEVGISYSGRTYEEGKKIGWKDGVRTLWCIFKHNLFT